jgi:hypothetical protein
MHLDGGHNGWVVRGYLFNCLQPLEPVLGTRGSTGAALSQNVGARAQVTCGDPGAALSLEAGAGAMGARGGPGAAPTREVGARAAGTHGSPQLRGGSQSRCLDLKLVHVGTRSSGYGQWPPGPPRERLQTYGWGQHPFPVQPF